MKFLLESLVAGLLIAATPGLVLAQTPAKPAAKPAAKPPAKPLSPAAQKAVEEGVAIEDDDDPTALTADDLAVAKKIHVGTISCELGAYVIVSRSVRRDGFFSIITRGHRYFMHPVASKTGAIRLEDPKRGAMWLQLGNKSMLMSQKLGQRIADECQNPDQAAIAEAMKKNPVPGLLDAVPQELTATPAIK